MASEGERPQYREGMERLTSQLIDGGYKPSVAEKLARDSVTRIDRKHDDKGLGPPREAR